MQGLISTQPRAAVSILARAGEICSGAMAAVIISPEDVLLMPGNSSSLVVISSKKKMIPHGTEWAGINVRRYLALALPCFSVLDTAL